MQKKLIALAVAGMMAAPIAAQAASAEVYGKVRMSAGIVSNDETASHKEDSKLNVSSHSSRVGFKGSEDLGGLTAVYQIETQVSLDESDTFGTKMRDTYVGLATQTAGTFVLGIHDTPYKDASGKIDVFSDTHADHNAIIGIDHDIRADNVIAWVSPDMSGFSVFAAYVTDANGDPVLDANGNQIPTQPQENDALSVAFMYNAGPLYASLAIQSITEGGVTGANGVSEDNDATKISVAYDLGATDLGFIYEVSDRGGSNDDWDAFYFSLKQDLGNDLALKAALGQAGDYGNIANSGASFYAIGVSKKMSKSAELYALYTAIDNDDNAGYDLDYVDAAGPGGPGASALAVGINLSFSSM